MKSETDSKTLPKRFADPQFAKFRDAVVSSEKDSLAKYFANMSEKERQEHAKYCCDYCKAIEKVCFVNLGFQRLTLDQDGLTMTPIREGQKDLGDFWWKTKSAVVATASWATLKNLNWFYSMEEIEPILYARRPPWTLEFLAKIVARIDLHHRMEPYWEAYRSFYRAGTVEPQRFDSVTELMFAVLSGSRFMEKRKRKAGEETSNVLAALKDDPDLIENELWHIFQIEAFRPNWSYTSHDAFDLWKDAFCDLILEGTIPRDRVFDGCFDALARHFTDHQTKWFVKLLEKLIEKLPVTEKELTADKRFLALLDHEHLAPRTLGVKIFERLLKADLLDLQGFAERLTPGLREKSKVKAKKILDLYQIILRKRSDLRNEIFRSTLFTLEHDTIEIQNAAMELLLQGGAFENPEIRNGVLERSASLAASVRKRIPDGNFANGNIAAANSLDAVLDDVAKNSKTLREPLEPIATFDELLDTAVQLVESAHDPDEIERFLDGLARLGTEKPKNFENATAPLLKRILKKLGDYPSPNGTKNEKHLQIPLPFSGELIDSDCVYLILSWLTGEIPTYTSVQAERKFLVAPIISTLNVQGKSWIHWVDGKRKQKCPAYCIFSERAKAVAEQVLRGVSQQLLSTPTHKGGWIDPMIFVYRLLEMRETKNHHDTDRVAALLRLDFSGREDALKLLDAKIKKRDEYIQAVRYALGASRCKIGKTAHYWIAAGRSRTPFDLIDALERAFPSRGPDAGEEAVYSIEKGECNQINIRCSPASKKKYDPALFPTIALHAPNTYHCQEFQQENPWKLTVWPSNPDPAIGAAIQSHFEYRDDNFDTGFLPYLQILQNQDVAINKIGAAAIFVGLAMKFAPIPTTATDTLIIAVAQNRLKIEPISIAIRNLLETGLLTPSRWLKPLKIVAEQSPKHTQAVREILEEIVPNFETNILVGFLEFLYEIVVETSQPIQNKATLKFLKSCRGSGKAAKLAQKLLGN